MHCKVCAPSLVLYMALKSFLDFGVKLNSMTKILIAKWQDLVVTQILTEAKRSVIRPQQAQGTSQLTKKTKSDT